MRNVEISAAILARQEVKSRGRIAAVQASPNLKAQAEAQAGGVDKYVDNWVSLLSSFSLRLAGPGRSPSDLFRRMATQAAEDSGQPARESIAADLENPQPPEGDGPAAAPRLERRHDHVTSMDDLYGLASQTDPEFKGLVKSLAELTGGQDVYRDGLKDRGRAERKLKDYQGDAARILDVLGGTILYNNRAEIEAALPGILQNLQDNGFSVVGNQDRFATPKDGYSDVLLNVKHPNGFVSEIQLNTRAMAEAKKLGHKFYELGEIFDDLIENEKYTKAELKELRKYRLKILNTMRAWYESTGAQSNEMASFSETEAPLNIIEEVPEPSKGSKRYPEIEALVGTILNSSPSSESRNGSSSKAMNESTIMGMSNPSAVQGVPTASRPSINRAMNGLRLDDGLEDGLEDAADIESPPEIGNEAPLNIGQNEEKVKPQNVVRGEETPLVIGEDEDQGHYEVWEAEDLIPSHDPAHNFAKRSDYPEGVQERPYHSDQAEQDKVRRNASGLKPYLLITDNPDAVNGPPIITATGKRMKKPINRVTSGLSAKLMMGIYYIGTKKRAVNGRPWWGYNCPRRFAQIRL